VKPANAEIRPGVAGIAVARFVGLKDVLQTDRHAYFCHLVSVGGITLQILTPSLLSSMPRYVIILCFGVRLSKSCNNIFICWILVFVCRTYECGAGTAMSRCGADEATMVRSNAASEFYMTSHLYVGMLNNM
jgi:hypothetical protein